MNMKKISFLMMILMMVLLNSCEKQEDIYGDKTFSGRLLVVNDVTGDSLARVQPNTEIRISFTGQNPATSYDKTDSTDGNGYFYFDKLPETMLH